MSGSITLQKTWCCPVEDNKVCKIFFQENLDRVEYSFIVIISKSILTC